MIYQQGTGSFDFRPGGVFANVVLADEINRGTPKTQSALLEVMAERIGHGRLGAARRAAAVPGGGHAEPDRAGRHLPAARGPARPVPDAAVGVGYPDHDAEVRVVLGAATGVDPDAADPRPRHPRSSPRSSRRCGGCTSIRWSRATRCRSPRRRGSTPPCATGPAPAEASRWWPPRGPRRRSRTGRSCRRTTSRTIAHAVLAHRIVLTPEAELNRRTAAEVLDDVLGAIPQPTPQPSAARA